MIPVPNAMSPFDGRSVLRLEKAPTSTVVAPTPPPRDLSVCATERDCAGMGVKFVPPPPSDRLLDLARSAFGEDFILEWVNGNWNTRLSEKKQKLFDQRFAANVPQKKRKTKFDDFVEQVLNDALPDRFKVTREDEARWAKNRENLARQVKYLPPAKCVQEQFGMEPRSNYDANIAQLKAQMYATTPKTGDLRNDINPAGLRHSAGTQAQMMHHAGQFQIENPWFDGLSPRSRAAMEIEQAMIKSGSNPARESHWDALRTNIAHLRD